jgi:hypothetical protein
MGPTRLRQEFYYQVNILVRESAAFGRARKKGMGLEAGMWFRINKVFRNEF